MSRKPGKHGSSAHKREPGTPPDSSKPSLLLAGHQYSVAAGIVVVLMMLLVCALATSNVIWPDDQYTDMTILTAGENFAKHGLLRVKLLPILQTGPLTDPPAYYTHYPPLSHITNGLLQIMGVKSLAVMRAFCGLLGIAGLVCMCRAFSPTIGSLASACGLGFVATSGFFLTYCISLHHTFNFLFLGIFFLCFLEALRREGAAGKWWIACWAALMLASLNSFEFILYPQVFAWVYVLATGQIRKRWKMLLILGTAPVLGVGLHYLQNCWALGWSAAAEDAVDAFKRPGRGPAQDRWVNLGRLPELISAHGSRLFYWSWPVLLLIAGLWVSFRSRLGSKTEDEESQGPPGLGELASLLLAITAASATWYLFMPNHVVLHPHTIGQLLPLAMVVMGGAVAVVVPRAFGWNVSLVERLMALIAVLVVALGQIQSVRECLDRAENRPVSFFLMEAMGEDALPPKSAILSNTYADAQMAYFLHRPLWRTPTEILPLNEEAIASLRKRLPPDWSIGYYIYDASRRPGELFRTLAEKCPGKIVTIPNAKDVRPLIVFDLGPWLDPNATAKGLDPETRAKQLRGEFPFWDQPGFQQRLYDVLSRHGRI
ncbi:MAG: hypothetical protein JXQ73_16320 [Phycisphaerae bacterium]|nr:hypothetical protein [Phycisphaerae bacterium]